VLKNQAFVESFLSRRKDLWTAAAPWASDS